VKSYKAKFSPYTEYGEKVQFDSLGNFYIVFNRHIIKFDSSFNQIYSKRWDYQMIDLDDGFLISPDGSRLAMMNHLGSEINILDATSMT
jgi:hypothetical protein